MRWEVLFSKFKFFYTIVFVIFTSLVTQASELSRDQFVKEVAKRIGHYELVGKASKHCHSGRLLFVNEKKPLDGLRFANKIFFGPLAKKESEHNEDGYCSILEKFNYTTNSITQTTKVYKCDKSHRGDEAVSTQIISFDDSKNELIYKSLESKITCKFKRVFSRVQR